MIAWLHRFIGVVRVSTRASMLFANIGTLLVSVFIVPCLDIIFSILLGSSLGSRNLALIAYSGVLLQMALCVCSVTCTAADYAKQENVIEEVLTRRKVDTAYWTGITVPGLVAGCMIGLVSALLIFLARNAVKGVSPGLFGFAFGIDELTTVFDLFPAALIAGFGLSIFSVGSGLPATDGFFMLNAVTALLPITSGAVVPLAYYPGFVRSVFSLLPLSSTIGSLNFPTSPLLVSFTEACKSLVFILVGLLITQITMQRIHKGISITRN